MWMHNGGIGGWKNVKRRLGDRLADKWYLGVKGGTDSEWAFALFLDTLERLGHDPSSCPENGFGPTVLRKAVEKTIAQINEMTDTIPESTIQSEDVDTRSLLNFAVTDGHSVICTRYISSSKDEAASLYYSSGTQWATKTASPDDRRYQMERKDKGADIVLVASEPLTFERENWVNVPTNSILTIHRQTVMMHPILDKYYERDPYHVRSSAFVQAKGLVSNEKAPSLGSASPAVDTPGNDGLKKMLGATAASRSLSPDLARRPAVPLRSKVSSQRKSSLSSNVSPGQGNVTAKRCSAALSHTSLSEDQSSDNNESLGADARNDKKLSQFFPELTLTSHSS